MTLLLDRLVPVSPLEKNFKHISRGALEITEKGTDS